MGGLDQNPMNFFLLKPIVGKDISIPEELVSNKTWNNVPPSQANPGEPPMIRIGLKIFPYIVYVLITSLMPFLTPLHGTGLLQLSLITSSK